MNTVGRKWASAWSDKRFVLQFILTLVLFAPVLVGMIYLLTWIESRQGLVLNDFVLNLYTPSDISVFIFSVTYGFTLLGAFLAFRDPHLTLRLMKTYTILLALRILTLWLVPLSAPATIIPLRDPFIEFIAYSGRANLNDLFFSGHTATIFMFFLGIPGKQWKVVFLIGTVFVAVGVLAQHVHYSVDVVGAPLFAWAAYWLAKARPQV